jgi:hypothetical protein
MMFSDGLYPEYPAENENPQEQRAMELYYSQVHDVEKAEMLAYAEDERRSWPNVLAKDVDVFSRLNEMIITGLTERPYVGLGGDGHRIMTVPRDTQDVSLIQCDVLSRRPGMKINFIPSFETTHDGWAKPVLAVRGNTAAKVAIEQLSDVEKGTMFVGDKSPEEKLLQAVRRGQITAFVTEIGMYAKMTPSYYGFDRKDFGFYVPRAFLAATIRYARQSQPGMDTAPNEVDMPDEQKQDAWNLYAALRTANATELAEGSNIRVAAEMIIKANRGRAIRPLDHEQTWGMVNGIVSDRLDTPDTPKKEQFESNEAGLTHVMHHENGELELE